MKRLRLGAVLHFIIAIGHLGCLFALDEAFDAYGIKDVMHNMVFGHVWMLYALTICLALAFVLAGLYALSATGDICRLPLTRTAIIVIIVLYSLRALAGGWACVMDFRWLLIYSSVIPAFIAWCYYPGLKIIVMEISNWFKGFEKGIARLSPEERSAFFSECGKNCVNGGTLSVYKKLYEDAKGNMDVFFQMANDLPGVKGEVVEKGHVYRLIFLKCTCELCKKGYVTTPLLCECSRQSVIYSLHSLWKDKNFTVTLCHSILGGGTDCEMRIEVDK
jgi:hypothetical protein